MIIQNPIFISHCVARSVFNVKGRKGGDENQSLTAWIFKIKNIIL